MELDELLDLLVVFLSLVVVFIPLYPMHIWEQYVKSTDDIEERFLRGKSFWKVQSKKNIFIHSYVFIVISMLFAISISIIVIDRSLYFAMILHITALSYFSLFTFGSYTHYKKTLTS